MDEQAVIYMKNKSNYYSPDIDFLNIFEKSAGSNILLKANHPAYTIIAVTDEYLKATHTRREEITGKGVFEVFPDNPENEERPGREDVTRAFLQVITNKTEVCLSPYSYSIWLPEEKTYKTLYWVNRNKPILDEQGNVAYILNTTEDVTDRVLLKKNEERAINNLKYQKEKVNALLFRAPIGIIVLRGKDLIVEYANEYICNIQAKYKPKEITGRPLFDIVSPINEKYKKILEDVYCSGNSFSGREIKFELFRNNKQTTSYFNIQCMPVYEADGSISGIFSSVIDVSEEVSVRKALEDSEHRLHTAIESSGAGIWDTNVITGESVRSGKHAEIFGYPDNSHPWSLKQLYSHVLPEDLDDLLQEIKRAYQTGKINIQTRIKTTGGLVRWVNITGKVFYNEKHEPVRMLGTTTDISERKELERQKDEFISIISHELKTPVTSIKAYMQMLQRSFKDGDHKMNQMLQKMDMQISRLSFLVKDLLDVTRIEGNKLRFNRERFEFNSMVKEVTEDMQLIHPAYNLITDLTGAVEVNYDKERIIQVLTNFIGNAIKYSPENKDIYISVSGNGKEIICSVRDFGIGIPEELQKSIFDRFYQIMDGKINSFPGLGLGLYISAEIIKRQNGNIWVQSEPGQGSTFYFSLPLN